MKFLATTWIAELARETHQREMVFQQIDGNRPQNNRSVLK